MNTSAGWKLLVVVLVGYSVLVTHALLDLLEITYRTANEARFPTSELADQGLPTGVGIGSVHLLPILLAAFVLILLGAEVVARRPKAT